MVEIGTQQRAPLSRKRVLDTAVALADEGGADALSMRRIAQALDVVPMALYKHGALIPVVDRTYALADTAEGLRHVERGHARGKAVIDVAAASESSAA
ncbi:zinc-binding dehydrogenase [Streptomyces sp. NPDC005811]|uniref:zinc-binding dehydrogenase n=1 Tax=Streptomyces sp. NPDC005811 TaxID=3154565 RepID=UPI00340D2889